MSNRRSTPQQREQWIDRFRKQACSAAEFCREHQLSYQTFLNWLRKAENQGEAPPRAAPHPVGSSFDYFTLENGSDQPASPKEQAEVTVKLNLPGGVVLSVSTNQPRA